MRTINREQFDALSNLANCVSAKAYLDEKQYRRGSANESIQKAIAQCDSLRIPFAVQMAAINCGRDWRTYKGNKLESLLGKEFVVTQ